MAKKKKKIGLLLTLGIEFNNFIHSGLAKNLSAHSDIYILTTNKSNLIKSEISKLGYKIIFLDIENVLSKKNRIADYFLSSRRARMRINGITPISWRGKSINLRLKDFLIGNYFIYSVLKIIYFIKSTTHYKNQEIEKKLKQYGITDVIMQSYSSINSIIIAKNAIFSECKIWVLNWGWKDFYINEFVPFQVNGFFTWSEKHKKLYAKFNKHINQSKFYSIGNPGYDGFAFYTPKKSKKYYAAKYGFDFSKKIILYTLINPDVFDRELNIISKIADLLIAHNIEIDILLKPNPMDTDKKRYESLLEKENIFVTENNWLYDKENNFSIMTKEAKNEWKDLLFHCDLTMNIASTVSIESLLMKKPVININFGLSTTDTELITKFGNSEYYKDLFKRNDIIKANSLNDVKENIIKIIEQEIKVNQDLKEYLEFTSDVTERISKIINK